MNTPPPSPTSEPAGVTQRWLQGRDYYRARAADFDPAQFGVELLPGDAVAREFVQRHHYSGSYPAARCRVGLYRRRAWFTPELVGVAVFSVPMQARAIHAYAPGVDGVELGRFVLLDEVPYNAETWFLRRAFGALRAALPAVRVVLSYSDPIPRSSDDGRVVIAGHVGSIYQGKGARYVGRATGRWLVLDRAGRVVSDRTLAKIRNDERGAAYAYRQLLAAGAPSRRPLEEGAAYVRRAVAEGPFRRLRHPGNHAYLFGVDGLDPGALSPRAALPYPKSERGVAA